MCGRVVRSCNVKEVTKMMTYLEFGVVGARDEQRSVWRIGAATRVVEMTLLLENIGLGSPLPDQKLPQILFKSMTRSRSRLGCGFWCGCGCGFASFGCGCGCGLRSYSGRPPLSALPPSVLGGVYIYHAAAAADLYDDTFLDILSLSDSLSVSLSFSLFSLTLLPSATQSPWGLNLAAVRPA